MQIQKGFSTLIGVIIVIIILVIIGGVYFYYKSDNKTSLGLPMAGNETLNNDFIKMGEKSFGLDVCNEMTKTEVAIAIGKEIVKIKDYNNSGSTGCEYFVTETSFVIIDVGYSDMANQKKGLEFLDRTIKTDDRIKLENFLSYTERGLNDIYMNVSPGQKFVRVGRSSTSAIDEETLIKLAIATEFKIRSYK
jgi:hypothetical protein